MTTKVNLRMIDQSFDSVKDFGAVGDGVTDDTTSIQLALDTGNDVIFPAGQYLITAQLNASAGSVLHGQGDCELIFQGAISGIVFDDPTDHAKLAGMVGFEITKTTAQGVACITTPRGAGFNDFRPMYIFDKLRFGGAYTASGTDGFAVDYSWATFFELGDSWLTLLQNIDALGEYDALTDPASQNLDLFCHLDAVQGILSMRMLNVTTHNIADFISIEEKAYFHLDNVDVSLARRGIVDHTNRVFEATPTDYGECGMHKVILNCQDYCIDLKNRFATSMVSVLCHRAVGYNIGTNWYGIRLEEAVSCDIAGVEVSVNTTNTDTAIGIELASSSNCSIRGAKFSSVDTCVRLDDSGAGACQGNTLNGVGIHSNVTTIFDLAEARSTSISNCEYNDAHTVTNEILYGNTATKVQTTISNVFGNSASIGSYSEYMIDGTNGYRYYIDSASGSMRRALVDSSFGSTTNFELVTRTGTNIDGIEWRGDLLFLNCSAGGNVRIGNIPTSSAGLSSGDVWANAGVLTIV